jgi:hypothetical protein
MNKRESTPDLYVLDMLADDVEDLATILNSLNSDRAASWRHVWGRNFSRQEVVQALSRLIREGLVRVAVLTTDGKWLEELKERELPPVDYGDVWFSITAHGQLFHQNWHPEVDNDPPQ